MGNVSIDELGINFVKESFLNYWGTIHFFGFYIMILFGFYLYQKKQNCFWIYYTLLLFATIYNPLLVPILKVYSDIDIVYYRFIWLLPVNIIVGYGFLYIILKMANKYKKVICSFIIVICIGFTGIPIINTTSDFRLPDNLYKVPDELITLCEFIHQNTNSTMPNVVFNRNYHMLVRQYDPSILLTLDRDLILFREGNPSFHLDESDPAYQIEKKIMDVVYYDDISDPSSFIEAVASTNTEFLVIPIKSIIHNFLLQTANYEQIAVTDNYVLYKTKP